MGLDAVEIVLRVEELFDISIENEEAAAVRTVGEFYELICAKLHVVPLTSPITSAVLTTITEKENKILFLQAHKPLPAPPEVLPWSPQSIWDWLVAVFVDQLRLRPEKVVYLARIAQDFGVDSAIPSRQPITPRMYRQKICTYV